LASVGKGVFLVRRAGELVGRIILGVIIGVFFSWLASIFFVGFLYLPSLVMPAEIIAFIVCLLSSVAGWFGNRNGQSAGTETGYGKEETREEEGEGSILGQASHWLLKTGLDPILKAQEAQRIGERVEMMESLLKERKRLQNETDELSETEENLTAKKEELDTTLASLDQPDAKNSSNATKIRSEVAKIDARISKIRQELTARRKELNEIDRALNRITRTEKSSKRHSEN